MLVSCRSRERQATRPRPKPARDRYHHGDLRRALLDEALRTIQDDGVEALTLRTIGVRLGVSRTALYRHFTDKRALLSAVATEGFRLLTERLLDAWERRRRPRVQRDGRGLHPLRDGQPVALPRDVRRLRRRPAARRGSDAGIDRRFSGTRRCHRRSPEKMAPSGRTTRCSSPASSGPPSTASRC